MQQIQQILTKHEKEEVRLTTLLKEYELASIANWDVFEELLTLLHSDNNNYANAVYVTKVRAALKHHDLMETLKNYVAGYLESLYLLNEDIRVVLVDDEVTNAVNNNDLFAIVFAIKLLEEDTL